MASIRDRFFTPGVARAITSPSAIVLTGAGVAAGILVFGNPVGAAVLGLGAFAARVAVAIPRTNRRPGIAPRTLDEPWRTLVTEVLDAERRFDRAVQAVRPGPLKDRLAELGQRLETAIDEAWRTASAGHALSTGRRQIDTDRIRADLQLAQQGPRTDRTDRTVASIQAQLASAHRLDTTISDTHDRLRLLDARIDETVTRAVELSVTQDDADALSGLGDEVESIVGEMEALRQAVEETRSVSGPDGTTLPGQGSA